MITAKTDQNRPNAEATLLELTLWRLDDRTGELLRKMWPKIAPSLDSILDEFYQFLGERPELESMLAPSGMTKRLKELQLEHWSAFFGGNFDHAYLNRVNEVGRTHARIGLEPKYYLSGFTLIMEGMLRALIERNRWQPAQVTADAVGVLTRALMMEAELVMSVYFETSTVAKTLINMQELAELFEHELDSAVEFVRRGAAGMEGAAGGVLEAARKVSQDSEQVASSSSHANDNAHTIAHATEELSASIAEISRQVEHSTAAARDAAQESEGARAIAEDLSKVSTRIGAIVQLIERIARETRLLALNANIEAARAGELGRGFAVVATEVKTLADQTNQATSDIRTEIQSMQDAIKTAVDSIGRVAERVQVVSGDIAGIASAVTEQEAVTHDIAGSVQETAESIRTVHERIASVAEEADASTREATNLQALTHTILESVVGIKRRVIATLRNTSYANRRKAERIAIDLGVVCAVGGIRYDGRTDNLSLGGAQVRQLVLATLPNAHNTIVDLDLDKIGKVRATIVEAEADALHLRFVDLPADVQERLSAMLEHCRREDDEIIVIAQEAATAIGAAFEAAIARHEVSAADLWDVDYQIIANTDPVQYTTRHLGFCDRLLPEIQEPLVTRNPRISFVAAVDRNGYLPTHNRQYSAPQRPNDRVWNTANCRNRRIFDDRTGLSAARNRQPILVQTYRRDMGGGQFVSMKDISAPIMIADQHWGSLRIGCRF